MLVLVCGYLLMHPYPGLIHDARLYTLQALNHLHPELYGTDVFLRYGSQDDYTLFTPLYAWAIEGLGVEPAAALLTFLSQVAFLAASFLLARTLMPATLALAAVILVVLLPDHYGAGKIFAYLEEFVTPRLFAESLVLAGVAAWMRGWAKAAVGLVAGAMLVHPIMGLAGAALLPLLALPIRQWRWILLLALLALLVTSLAAVFGWIPAQWLIDDQWLEIVLSRAGYLSFNSWTGDDWGRVATLAATLAIAARALQGPMQRLAAATLMSTCALMLLALIGGHLLHIALVLQAQPWRALWLATVISMVLLPALFYHLWYAASLQRAGLLLLAAAWLTPSENLALLIGPLAAAAVFFGNTHIREKDGRALVSGSWAALALVVAHALAASVLSWRVGAYGVAVSPWLDALRSASTSGVPLLLLILCGWLLVRRAARPVVPALAAILSLLGATTAWPTARTWFDFRFEPEMAAAFSGWRQRIPPGSDVMWATERSLGPDGATSTWLLLERPSFVSRIQATTSLFSRDAALEVQRRARSIQGRLPDIGSLDPAHSETRFSAPLKIAPVCRASTVKFIVTQAAFVDATPIEAPAHIRPPFRNLKLYTCP